MYALVDVTPPFTEGGPLNCFRISCDGYALRESPFSRASGIHTRQKGPMVTGKTKLELKLLIAGFPDSGATSSLAGALRRAWDRVSARDDGAPPSTLYQSRIFLHGVSLFVLSRFRT